MERRYTIGIDFGTESGRAVLVDTCSGEELACHVTRYPHGVMDESLPSTGKRLGHDWALQHPDDYLLVLRQSVPEVLRAASVDPAHVIGIGVDFTSCTMLPVDADGRPLCALESFRDEPHAYVKLWKHHAAHKEAARINELARARREPFLNRYGGQTSPEWMLAKAWQVLNEAPEVYEAAHHFVEAGDWIVSRMTGRLTRSGCGAGYKAMWHKADGYPPASFLRELDPRLERFADTKLSGDILPLGARAGELTDEAAAMMGLCPGTSVAAAIIDAHAGVPGAGAVRAGQMVMAMGTSLCHMLLSDKEVHMEGVTGVVEDGIIPGLFGYEAGQPAVGDLFGWFVRQALSPEVAHEAQEKGIDVHSLLERRASSLNPGEHGLLALDWWNGNRSVLADTDLSGLIVGLTLQTKPEDIYRALLEATAYGTRKIIETYEEAGLAVEELFACGGLPQRNRLLMQIYADVTGREIKLSASAQTPALGAAIWGAVAAGKHIGGYDTVMEACASMAKLREETFRPDPQHRAVYDRLYEQYNRLHDLFGGRGSCQIMQELKRIKLQQSQSLA
ncbi:ribulokinase [Paenibacillus sp. NPDC056579]|uniref:ribulokinase n=1 Tax=Paenibacillus sp. NPDC056579 TaxID=3345871 RepID=UPI00367ACDC4